MWPWEHAVVGYVLYSLSRRARGRDPPADMPTIALLVGTQLPDLIDKPLSWGLGLFPTGYAVGHSAIVALTLSVAAGWLAVRAERRQIGTAFLFGYWSHLLTDVLNPLRYGNGLAIDRVGWPLVSQPPYEESLGLERGVVYLWRLGESLLAVDAIPVLGVSLLVGSGTLALWVADGKPGLAVIASVRRQLT